MTVIGLDGFSKGWVAVSLDGGRARIDFIDRISWLDAQRFARAGIDIPIGMTDDGDRGCDRLARSALRPHGSRVFSGARRWLWDDFTSPAEANLEAGRRGQTRISLQLWHIGLKIMEVDGFVRAHPDLDLREVHPELTFLRLNGGRPLPSKHTEQGLALRRDLLLREGFGKLDIWLSTERIGTGARRDDVLDACAVAVAARDCAGSLPANEPPRDAHGLPMQIWF
jgi:predicted RNase H-like nuclease